MAGLEVAMGESEKEVLIDRVSLEKLASADS